MNKKYRNIRHCALICGVFLMGSLLFWKDTKIAKSKKPTNTTEKYTINFNGHINSVVDYLIDSSVVESAAVEPDVNFKQQDHVQYSNNSKIDVDTAWTPQINYLHEDAIEDYSNYSVKSKGKKLTYIRNDTVLFVRENGTLPWRNNNPGALRYTEFTKHYGAIGKGSRNFAVFPTREAGILALKALLQSDSYKKLRLGRAIEIFAPEIENDTEAYKRKVHRLTGIRLTKRLYELSNEEFERVVAAIIRLEGSVPGKETIFVKDTFDITKNTNTIIDTFFFQQKLRTL